MSEEAIVFVPWDNKDLGISFSTFRDKLTPGGRETWRVTVKTPGGKPADKGAAELLAYMYDRSLDLFAPHRPPRVSGLYPYRAGTAGLGRRARHGARGVRMTPRAGRHHPRLSDVQAGRAHLARRLRHRRAGRRMRGVVGRRRGGVGRRVAAPASRPAQTAT